MTPVSNLPTPAGTRPYVVALVRKSRVVLEPASRETHAQVAAQVQRQQAQRAEAQTAYERTEAVAAWAQAWRWWDPRTWRRPG